MKYSDETTKEICNYLRAGNNQRDSAILAGISEDTFYTWMKEHSEFSEALKKAEQECKARNIAFVQKAADKSWQAAAWYLERKYNNEYALKNINEHYGKDGEAIKLTIIGGGFVPGSVSSYATSTGDTVRKASEVQGGSLAQAGKENDNSNNGTGETVAS